MDNQQSKGSSRKEETRKLLEASGAKYVQKTGSILMILSKKQRESMEGKKEDKKD